MKPRTAIAISGGIDSLMAGYLLKQQGHDLVAVHFDTGFDAVDPAPVAAQLDIPCKVLDIREPFARNVIDYFSRTYQAGKTPNPCMVCNQTIKFGLVSAYAETLGASRIATGHYARSVADDRQRFHLYRGCDAAKDQSYFLARLSQRQLARALFPLGDLTKQDVKAMAAKNGLTPAARLESQDVCFIRGRSYGDFLRRTCGLEPRPGPIEDLHGNLLGEHNGLHLFTIGQRRGINCPAAEPYYVVRLDTARNRLVVGSKKDLLSSSCRVVDINWIVSEPAAPLRVHTRLRYRHRAALSRLVPRGDGSAVVEFETPQTSVTPGQGAVFYQDDEVLGGGWIV